MAGLKDNEGTIISRDRFGVAHADTLSEDRWYLLQTNSDHWTGDCPIRCQKGNERIQAIGR